MLLYDIDARLTASQALSHPFFTDESKDPPCQPRDLPFAKLEDNHELVAEAVKFNRQDVKKFYTFRHNLIFNQSSEQA